MGPALRSRRVQVAASLIQTSLGGEVGEDVCAEPGEGLMQPHKRACTLRRTLTLYPLPFTLFLLLSNAAQAQQPDVQVKVDLLPTGFTGLDRPNSFRWYDDLAHYSTVGLSVTFEQGFHAYVSERLERLPNNADSEQLDEYYFEDPGIWRLGKQYLPFRPPNSHSRGCPRRPRRYPAAISRPAYQRSHLR